MPAPSPKPFEVQVDCKYGAPMGRSNYDPIPAGTKVYLQRVPLVDGAYDKGGAYWGGPSNLYCAWYDNDHVIFVRANSRNAAKEQLLGLRFHR